MIVKIECDESEAIYLMREVMETIEQSQIFFNELKSKDIHHNGRRYLMTVSKAGNVFVRLA